ncbi:MAG: 3'-5' exonuclease [Bacteroidetes bacterium]|nr:3'-5' exonuclease [Bacteroidota bacterium]
MKLENILFLDIETVSHYSEYEKLPEKFKSLWDKKFYNSWMNTDDKSSQELYREKAAIFAEYGKIVVIGLGFLYREGNEYKLRVGSLYNNDEKELLKNFKELIENKFYSNLRLCAHNGKEFDFPYICRRMLVNNIEHPEPLKLSNKKPWEVNHIDTMEMWKFGDRKAFTSLDLLTQIFGIESSKQTMDGSEVHDYYYKKNDLESISKYCIDDVIALVQVFLKLNSLDTIPKENIKIADELNLESIDSKY